MRNSLIIFVALLIVSCSSTPQYKIEGSVSNDFDGLVYLKKQVGYSFEIIDSAQVKDHAFIFKGIVDRADMYAIAFKGQKGVKHFCLENTTYQFQINDQLSKAQITGGSHQPLINSFSVKMSEIEKKEKGMMNGIRKIWNDSTVDKTVRQKLRDDIKTLRKDKVAFAKKYVSDNSTNPHALTVLNIYIRNYLNIDQLDSIYQTFDDDVKQSNMGYIIGTSITNTRLSAVGQPFIDFSVPDADGKMIALSDVVKNNKVVFIDFWASWCGPCRASIPHLKELYHKYHKKGFEIIAVSYDDKKENWLKAIKEEELEWLNASNLKGWNCPTALQYAVRGIPATILISNDGKIAGRSLHGEALANKIEELLERT